MNKTSLKAVCYIRVSTKEQDEKTQLKALKQYAKQNNIEIVEVYVDKGESGGKVFIERPAARKLLNEIDLIKPDIILSWSIDRLGRTMIDTINTITSFEKMGYKVVTIKEEWMRTLNENIRNLILGILAWAAEFERKRMKERREEAWRQGKQKGRPVKIKDETLIKYFNKYYYLNKKDIWKIMKQDGYNISYDWFLSRLNKLLTTRK